MRLSIFIDLMLFSIASYPTDRKRHVVYCAIIHLGAVKTELTPASTK